MRGIITHNNVSESDIIAALREEGIDEMTTLTLIDDIRDNERRARAGAADRTYLELVFAHEVSQGGAR